ncbi:autophagy- protein 2 [Basidiobolus ranarum]|uniref:Autophagy-related protein 2 n=1 Tax=Basidiobolus ranarum TaxID=34480 RepID=A0ABR2W6R4_9FUNG
MRGWSFSDWTLPATLQKRLVKFLLKRAIGQFLLEELDIDNLDIQLGTGFVQLKELQLNTEVLNDLISDLPITITHGKIGGITVQVPWKDIWSGNCVIEFHNLEITVIRRPHIPAVWKLRVDDSHIFSSSIHFAGDFLRHEMPNTNEGEELRKSIIESVHIMQNKFCDKKSGTEKEQPELEMEPGTEGLQVLAGVIDNIISNVKVTFRETRFRVHHQSKKDLLHTGSSNPESYKNYYVDITMPSMSYRDENQEDSDLKATTEEGFSPRPVESVKIFSLEGLNISLHEQEKTGSLELEERAVYSATLLSTSSHENTVRVRTKRSLFDRTTSQYTPNWDVEWFIQSIVTIVSPSQIHALTDIINAFTVTPKSPKRNSYFDDDLTNPNYREDLRRRNSYQSTRRKSSADYLYSPSSKPGLKPTIFDNDKEQLNSGCGGDQERATTDDLDGEGYFGRLKVHIASWCSYFLATDANPSLDPGSERFNTKNPNEVGADHINIHLETLTIGVKKWIADTGNSSVRGDYDLNKRDVKNGQLVWEMYANKFDISEWINPQVNEPSTPSHVPYHSSKRGVYLPILRFDPGLTRSYDSSVEVSMNPPRGFPSFCVDSKPTSNAFMEGKKLQNALRLRLTISDSGDSPHDNQTKIDILVESQPLHIFINPQVINRYQGFFPISETTTTENSSDENGFEGSTSGYDEQGIINDLDERALTEHSIRSVTTQFRISTEFLRIWLAIPDLRGALSSEEVQQSQSQCRIHEDALIVDLIDLFITNVRAISNVNQMLQPESLQRFYPYKKDTGLPTEIGQSCIRFEWLRMNIFLKEATDSVAMCFLVVEPMLVEDSLHQILPNIEVTSRVQGVKTSTRSKPPYNQSYFPQTFSSFEGEERVKFTDEDEEEEVVMFKQRTLENSVHAVNCNLPNIFVMITKHRLDLIQTLLDSLSRWKLHSNLEDTRIKPISFGHISSKLDQINAFGNVGEGLDTNATSEPTSLLDVEEKLDFELPNPSLVSLVVVMHNIDVAVVCSSTIPVPSLLNSPSKLYELQLSELGFFGVVGFEGKDVSYFNLDIEEFSLSDITNSMSQNSIISKINTDVLKTRQNKSMLLSTFVITTNKNTGKRDNLATIAMNNVIWDLQLESTFMEDMILFGTGSNDTSSEVSTRSTVRLFLVIENSLIDYSPNDHPTKCILMAESLKISSNLVSGSPSTQIKVFLQNADVLLVDDSGCLNEDVFMGNNKHYFGSLKSYYRGLGYAVISSVDFLEVIIKLNKDELPRLDLEITNQSFVVETCSDSFQTLVELIDYISQKLKNSTEKKGSPAQLEVDEVQSNDNDDGVLTDMLSSLDENAFSPSKLDSTKLASDINVDSLSFVEEYYAPEIDLKKSEYDSSEEYDTFEDYSSEPDDSGDDEWKSVKANIYPQTEDADFKESLLDLEDSVKMLDDEQLIIVEDHFSDPSFSKEQGQSSAPQGLNHIQIREFNFTWKLYAGSDWIKNRQTVDTVTPRSEPSSLKSSRGKEVLFSTSPDFDYYVYEPELMPTTPSGSEYASSAVSSERGYFDDDETMSVPEHYSTTDHPTCSPRKSRNRSKYMEKRGRSKSSQFDIKLISINASFEQHPLGVETAFRVRFTIRDIEIIDRVRTSMWKKFLSYLRPDSDTSPRESWSNMVCIELDGVRPVPNVPLEEMRLKIRLLPIRLHIDQDTLEFVMKFFDTSPNMARPKSPQRKEDIYFQYFEVLPIVLKFDYKPKHLDFGSLKGGNFSELVNLFRLEEADMMLLGVKLKGINGIDRLLEELGSAWKPYIISTQVPNVVTGVAPIKTLVNLGNGLADLVLLPVEQYLKDGQLIRGFQRGASSFAKATTMEIIKLGTKLAVGAQGLLEQADIILSFEETHQRRNSHHEVDSEEEENASQPKSKYSEQPSGLNEGIELAYKSLSKNIGNATHSLITVPIQTYDRSGAQSSIRALVRGTPSAVLKPMIGATEALSKVLLGARNTIDPSKRLQMEDKYK